MNHFHLYFYITWPDVVVFCCPSSAFCLFSHSGQFEFLSARERGEEELKESTDGDGISSVAGIFRLVSDYAIENTGI